MNPALIGNIIALVLAFLGFVGTVSALIMNLRVTAAVAETERKFTQDVSAVNSSVNEKIASVALQVANSSTQQVKDSGEVKLELANIRTRLAEDRANLYREIMTQMENRFMDRQLSLSMHQQNQEKIEDLTTAINEIRERLPV